MRIKELDLLRAIAIIFVLITHSSIIYALTNFEKTVGYWFTTFTRPCIAIFLFVSGYLLADKTFGTTQLFFRLKRVIIPFIIFSVLALWYRLKSEILSSIANSPIGFMFHFAIGNAFGIYYFVSVIIVIYILFFLVRKVKMPTVPILLLFGIICLIHTGYYDELISIFNLKETKLIKLYSYRYIFWPFFFFLGVFFYENQLIYACKKKKNYIIAIWIFIFLVYNFFYFKGVKNIDGFNSVIGTLYSIATIFILLSLDTKASKLTEYLSKTSYYLYLSHIFIVYGLYDGARYLGIPLPFEFSVISFILSLTVPLILYEIQRRMFKDRLNAVIGV